MENIEENVVTKGAAKADPMPSSGIPVEDLGGPTPENYKPDDDSAKLKDPALTLAQVKDVVNAKAMKAEEAETEEEVIEEEEATTDEVVAEEETTTEEESTEVVAEEETSEEETVAEEEEKYRRRTLGARGADWLSKCAATPSAPIVSTHSAAHSTSGMAASCTAWPSCDAAKISAIEERGDWL